MVEEAWGACGLSEALGAGRQMTLNRRETWNWRIVDFPCVIRLRKKVFAAKGFCRGDGGSSSSQAQPPPRHVFKKVGLRVLEFTVIR